MNKIYRNGAAGALPDKYEKQISELQKVLGEIPDDSLVKTVDTQIANKNCNSIQTILSHVVRSGYARGLYPKPYR